MVGYIHWDISAIVYRIYPLNGRYIRSRAVDATTGMPDLAGGHGMVTASWLDMGTGIHAVPTLRSIAVPSPAVLCRLLSPSTTLQPPTTSHLAGGSGVLAAPSGCSGIITMAPSMLTRGQGLAGVRLAFVSHVFDTDLAFSLTFFSSAQASA
jgi:hypothetical protein